MAIKKVPSDASIRIGSIWFPVRNLPAALAGHTKLVFCLTGSDDHPYSLRGSATGLKFQDRHLLFCCGHQIANIEPRSVVIPLDKEGRTLISGQQMVSLDHVQELLGEEILDLTAMRFDPAKYGPSPVDLGFFDREALMSGMATRRPRFSCSAIRPACGQSRSMMSAAH